MSAGTKEDVSIEQVRQHLHQMGFQAVPDELVHELRGELLVRMSNAAPKQKRQSGYEADDSEYDKENDSASEANKVKGTAVSRERGAGSWAASNKSHPRPATASKEKAHVYLEIEGGDVESSKEVMREEGKLRNGGKGAVTASSSSVLSGNRSLAGSSIIRPATQVLLLCLRFTSCSCNLSGQLNLEAPPAENVVAECCVATDLWSSPASLGPSVSVQENTGEMAACSSCHCRWHCEEKCRANRCAPGSRGNQALKSFPRVSLPDIEPHQQPQKIWKAHHPLDNATSANGYQVPTTKARTREREQVRQSMPWSEVNRNGIPKCDEIQCVLSPYQIR